MLILSENFAVKCKLCVFRAFFERTVASESRVRILSRNRSLIQFHRRVSREEERMPRTPRELRERKRKPRRVDAPSVAFSNTSPIPYSLIPTRLVRSWKRRARATPHLPGCIPARAYFNINNWRANFPRTRARVISGRRDGDASVCDRDPAASRRLRHSVSLPLFSSFLPFFPRLLCLPCRDPPFFSFLPFGISCLNFYSEL